MANTDGALKLQARFGLSQRATDAIDKVVVGTILEVHRCREDRIRYTDAELSNSEWAQEIAAYISELEGIIADRRSNVPSSQP